MGRIAAAGLAAALLPLAAAQPAAAACSFAYPAFEASVPHVDLADCPAGVAPGTFCRAAIANDMLHVFVFAEDAEACLVEVLSLEEAAFEIVLK